MSIEDRKKYFSMHYEDEDFLYNINYQEFFDKEMFDYLDEVMFLNLSSNIWIELIKTFSSNQELIDRVIHLLCKHGGVINQNDFNNLMNNKVIADSFLESYLRNLSQNDNIKLISQSMILYNKYIVSKIINNKSLDVNKIYGVLLKGYKTNLSKENILMILKDERFIDMLNNCHIDEFLDFIDIYNLQIELNDLLKFRISSLSYKEKKDIVKYRYNPSTNKPEYLQELWDEFKDIINLNNERSKIVALRETSSERYKEEVRKLLLTSEGMTIFLEEVLEPQFSNVMKILNLNKSLYSLRKEKLRDKLENYQDYDIETIKNLLCIYCFEDNYKNIILKLKTLIEYVDENDEMLLFLKNDIKYLIKLYLFLSTNNLEINPLELLSNININELINKAYSLFNNDVNKKTNIIDIIKSSHYKENNGVKVIDLNIPIDRSYFLVHSIGYSDIKDNFKEQYLNEAIKHNRICMSLLDNNHSKTFLDGIVFGYCNVNNPLYSAVPFDGQTSQRSNSYGRAQYRSVLSSIEKFMNRTIGKYNELTYMTNSEVIMPSYIFVVDREPNELEYKVAKEFDIPILIYHPKVIENKQELGYSKPECFNYESYVIDYYPNENNKKNITENNK